MTLRLAVMECLLCTSVLGDCMAKPWTLLLELHVFLLDFSVELNLICDFFLVVQCMLISDTRASYRGHYDATLRDGISRKVFSRAEAPAIAVRVECLLM